MNKGVEMDQQPLECGVLHPQIAQSLDEQKRLPISRIRPMSPLARMSLQRFPLDAFSYQYVQCCTQCYTVFLCTIDANCSHRLYNSVRKVKGRNVSNRFENEEFDCIV